MFRRIGSRSEATAEARASETGEPGRPHPRLAVRVIGGFVLVLLAFLVAEGAARLAYAVRERVQLRNAVAGGGVDLDAYETRDPEDPTLVRLRSGYVATLRSLLAEKESQGSHLAVAHLRSRAGPLGYRPDDLLFRVNRAGFKGPELASPDSARMRILNLGDSCTFGSWFDRYSYPRALERELARGGAAVEVINGGVEGYTTRSVLARIEEFKALRPDVVTLYVGWNDLYSEPGIGWAETHLYSVRLLGDLARALDGRSERELFERAKRPRRDDPALERLERYTPGFLSRVERIAEEMESAGSRVVVLTLPGLYDTDEAPSETALRIGHLPAFTDNPYVLATMTRRYNEGLRALARRRGLTLVDLDAWSRQTLRPADAYFIDSVHLTEQGQERLGRRLAAVLLPLVRGARSEVASSDP